MDTQDDLRQAFPVKGDDPYHRIRAYAEARAKLNGRDPIAAGRAAMAMLKLTMPAPQKGLIPTIADGSNIEHILQTVAGEYPRKKA